MQKVGSSFLLTESHVVSIHRLPSRFVEMSVTYITCILEAEQLLSADIPVHRIEPVELPGIPMRMSFFCTLYSLLWQEHSLGSIVYLRCVHIREPCRKNIAHLLIFLVDGHIRYIHIVSSKDRRIAYFRRESVLQCRLGGDIHNSIIAGTIFYGWVGIYHYLIYFRCRNNFQLRHAYRSSVEYERGRSTLQQLQVGGQSWNPTQYVDHLAHILQI